VTSFHGNLSIGLLGLIASPFVKPMMTERKNNATRPLNTSLGLVPGRQEETIRHSAALAQESFALDFIVDEKGLDAAVAKSDALFQAQSLRATRYATRNLSRMKRKVQNLPPDIEITPMLSCRFRFAVATGATVAISAANLIAIAGACGTVVNTTATCVFTCVRVRRITIWPELATTSATIPTIDWVASVANTSSEKSHDRSLPAGQTNERPVSSVPPRGTLIAGTFLNASFGNVVNVSAGTGSIIDVEGTWMMKNNLNPVTFVVSATPVGTLFYPALDGPANHKIPPSSLPTST
jgi:hypothetical protein